MYFVTAASYGTTGVKAISCGFQPTGMRITVGAKSGSAGTVNQRSEGQSDGTNQTYTSNYTDATSSQSKQGINKIISHYERVAGALTEKIAGTFDSFTPTQGKFNLSAADNNYTLIIELWD